MMDEQGPIVADEDRCVPNASHTSVRPFVDSNMSKDVMPSTRFADERDLGAIDIY